MKIRGLRLRNMPLFRHANIDFYDSVRRKVLDRIVIVGKNGSGKTTLLEIINAIINLLEQREAGLAKVAPHIFNNASAELQLDVQGYEKETFVVRTGNSHPFQGEPDDLVINKPIILNGDPFLRGAFVARNKVMEQLLQDIKSATAGIEDDPQLGNLLFFPTDRLTHFENQGEITNEQPLFEWCYRYNRDQKQWKGSLESYLAWVYFRDLKLKENRFDEFKDMVNLFLEDKKITTVNLNYNVEVVDVSGNTFGLEALSAGEKQIVLLIGEIYRYIRKGSIVMIDEPELHLHPVWQRIFVSVLTKFCKKYDAQLILTTQSPGIAESVMGYEVIELDNLLEESGV